MQVVEMNHVILHQLRTSDQIADQPRVVRDRDAQGVFDGTHGSQRVNGGADAADALGKDPGVTWITIAQNKLDATKHRPGTPRVGHLPILHFYLDA
jgi:hypothetical protein